MRPIQPLTKLQLLDDQARPQHGRALAFALVLLLVSGWNAKVIHDRYWGSETAEAAPAAEAAEPVEAAPDAAPPPVETGALVPAPEPAAPRPALDEETFLASALPIEPAAELVPASEAVAYKVTAGVIARGKTMGQALATAGLSPEQSHEVISSLKGIFDFRRARPGDGFRIKTTPEGELVFFDYESSPAESYCAKREDGVLVAYKREIPVDKEIVTVAGHLSSSLYESMDAVGERPALAMLLSDVLAWDIDFYRDPQRGDTFKIAVEKYFYKGRLLRYGEVLAAEYKGAVGTHRVFRYEDPSGKVAYYDERGQSAQKAFLKAPLPVVRITSRYGMRRHPVLGYSKMHQGVDYGAPTGTPVWAVGDGTVVWAGWKGANGKLVSVRHANGFTSHYAHLSAIDVRQGQRVRQKQVVGKVGSTGRSTGPHLHYGLNRGNHVVNPLSIKLPPQEPLPAKLMPEYQALIQPYLDVFEVESLARAAGARSSDS